MTFHTPETATDGRAASSGVELTPKGEAYAQAALAASDGVFFLTVDSRDRAGIATSIERLINMLDDMDEDPDIEHAGDEADQSYPEDVANRLGGSFHEDDEPTLGAAERHPACGWGRETKRERKAHSQELWAASDAVRDDREDEDDREAVCEDEGADIQSQPHDQADQGDDEPFLGWSEAQSEHGAKPTGAEYAPAGDGPMNFNGDGAVAARKVLRNLQSARPDVPQEYVGGFCTGDHTALGVDHLRIISGKHREKLGPDELTIIRPGVAMIGGYRPSPAFPSDAITRAFAPLDPDEGLTPEIDPRWYRRAAHGHRP